MACFLQVIKLSIEYTNDIPKTVYFSYDILESFVAVIPSLQPGVEVWFLLYRQYTQ